MTGQGEALPHRAGGRKGKGLRPALCTPLHPRHDAAVGLGLRSIEDAAEGRQR